MAYEMPRYEVVEEFEAFELRRYAPYLVAETEVSGDFDDVGGRAFRVLAGYIGGANRAREEIAMTAPVGQQPAGGEKIAMTAPVLQAPQGGDARSYTFWFVMPSKYTRDTLPEPTDPRVRIREVPSRLLAARRYSGTWSEGRYRRNEAALLAAVDAAGLERVGAPVFARYNAPFTPWFLRRNEVLIEVAPPVPAADRQITE